MAVSFAATIVEETSHVEEQKVSQEGVEAHTSHITANPNSPVQQLISKFNSMGKGTSVVVQRDPIDIFK